MRAHPIYCDWCGALITERVIVYAYKWLVSHATYEGARDTYDFCSDEHLVAWKDEAAMRKIAQARTHRVVGADEEAAAEYRTQLADEIELRVTEALQGRRPPRATASHSEPS